MTNTKLDTRFNKTGQHEIDETVYDQNKKDGINPQNVPFNPWKFDTIATATPPDTLTKISSNEKINLLEAKLAEVNQKINRLIEMQNKMLLEAQKKDKKIEINFDHFQNEMTNYNHAVFSLILRLSSSQQQARIHQLEDQASEIATKVNKTFRHKGQMVQCVAAGLKIGAGVAAVAGGLVDPTSMANGYGKAFLTFTVEGAKLVSPFLDSQSKAGELIGSVLTNRVEGTRQKEEFYLQTTRTHDSTAREGKQQNDGLATRKDQAREAADKARGDLVSNLTRT